MTLASRMRTGVKSATDGSHITSELNEGWPATACGAATFSFKAASTRCIADGALRKLKAPILSRPSTGGECALKLEPNVKGHVSHRLFFKLYDNLPTPENHPEEDGEALS
ncbi:hypothetical protein CXP40_22330 [Pseudomonas sp. YY-1]|nr:hypothetical protein CXP40_22330 [Pseudomonas sp. YY-1]